MSELLSRFDISSRISDVISKRGFAEILRQPELSIGAFYNQLFQPLPTWFRNQPTVQLFNDILVRKVTQLYSPQIAEMIKNSLMDNWVGATGGHLTPPNPSRYDMRKDVYNAENGANAIVTNGELGYIASANAANFPFVLFTPTARISANNPVGTYGLRLGEARYSLVPASKDSAVELFQPPIDHSRVRAIERDLTAKKPGTREHSYKTALLSQLETLLTRSGHSFTDQVALLHANMTKGLLPEGAPIPITVELDQLVNKLLIEVLNNADNKFDGSFIYSMFSSTATVLGFIEAMDGHKLGWILPIQDQPEGKGSVLFYQVTPNGKFINLKLAFEGQEAYLISSPPKTAKNVDNLRIRLNKTEILDYLQQGMIFPTGALKFTILLADVGFTTTGGWSQAAYLTDLKQRLTSFLTSAFYDDIERAEAVSEIVTDIPLLGPSYSLGTDGFQATAVDLIHQPLTLGELGGIGNIQIGQALALGAPAIGQFSKGIEVPLSVSDIYKMFPDPKPRIVYRN